MVARMQQTVLTNREKERSAKHDHIADPDELQLKDELNRKWVNSWKKAVKQ
jgi:hypothetical protein